MDQFIKQFIKQYILRPSMGWVILVVGSLVLPQTGWASTASSASNFVSDASTVFLTAIFGLVSDGFRSVMGDNTTILGTAFRAFNAAITSIGVVMIVYITMAALMQSAHSGTPMGGKWHSMFLPMRITLGAIFLVPNGYGYGAAQAAVMWCILTGVTAADTLWQAVLDRTAIMGASAVMGTAATPNGATQITGMTPNDLLAYFNTVGQAALCANLIDSQNPTALPTLAACVDDTNCTQLVVGNDYNNGSARLLAGNQCGTINVSPSYADIVSSGVNAMKGLVVQPVDYDSIAGQLAGDKAAIADATTNDAGAGSQDYVDMGWIAAAGVYYQAVLNSGSGQQIGTNPPILLSPSGPSVASQVNAISAGLQQYFNAYGTAGGAGQVNQSINITLGVNAKGLTPLTNMIINAFLSLVGIGGGTGSGATGFGGAGILSASSSPFSQLDIDPLKKISDFGSWLALAIEITIGVGIVASFAATALASIGYPCQPAVFAIMTLIMTIVFFVGSILALFWSIGIIMNLYIPLIPFAIYSVGVIGWLMLCIEAMAAAPIMAIGLMSPGGHEHFGRADQGLMMLLNVMLRPMLMLIGFLAAVILARVGIIFFTWTFGLALGNVQIYSLGAIGGVIGMYGAAIIVMMHQIFGLINQLPDRVLTWIGGHGQGVGDSNQMLQGIKGGADEGGGMPNKAFNAGMQGAQQGAGKAKAALGSGGPAPGGGLTGG